MFITGVKYLDGTIIKQDEFYGGLTEGYNLEGDYTKIVRFQTVVDLEQITDLLIGEEYIEIKLK